MKKIYMLSLVAMMFLTVSHINAQTGNLIKGGTFKTTDASSWTVGVSAAGFSGEITLGVTDGLPAGSKSTTGVKLGHTGSGGSEAQMYQKVNLTANVTYQLSAKLRIKGSMHTRAAQIFMLRDVAPTNGTMFSDGNIGEVGGKAETLFLEGWPFTMSEGDAEVDINGEFPLSTDGPGSELFTPDVDGVYIILFKVGQWGQPDPFSVVVSDLRLIDITELTGNRNISQSNSVSIYASKEKLIIKGASKQAKIEVYDLLGKKMVQNKNISGESIDISNFKAGIYIAKVNDGGTISTQKFIKR